MVRDHAGTSDPAVDDAFYCMYGEEGANSMTASKSLYGNDTQSPTVPHFGTVQQDFNLATGHLAATPSSLEITLVPGSTGSQTLTLQNVGGVAVNWEVKELPGHVSAPSGNLFAKKGAAPGLTKAQMMTRAFRQERAEEADEAKGERIVLSLDDEKDMEAKARKRSGKEAKPNLPMLSSAGRGESRILPMDAWPPSGPVQLFVDDGVAEDSIGLTGGGTFVWLNRFTPNAGDFPFLLDQVSVIFNNTVAVGDNMELVIWADTDGDGDPGTGATFLYSENVTVQNNDFATWNNYTLASPVLCAGPGDVLVGLVNRSGFAGYSDYPAAIDETASQGRSWIGAYSAGSPPDPPTLPSDSLWGTIDSFGLAGNWTVRASGYPADIPWIDEVPKDRDRRGGGEPERYGQLRHDGPGERRLPRDAVLHQLHALRSTQRARNAARPRTGGRDLQCGPHVGPGSDLRPNFTGSATGGIPPYTYSWDFGDGSPHSTAQNPAHVYYLGGTFTVVFTATDSGGHSDSATMTMDVTPPNVEIMTFFMDDGGACQVRPNRMTGEDPVEHLLGALRGQLQRNGAGLQQRRDILQRAGRSQHVLPQLRPRPAPGMGLHLSVGGAVLLSAV